MFHLLHHPIGVKQMKRLKFRRQKYPLEQQRSGGYRLFIDETKSCSIESSGYRDGMSVETTQVQPNTGSQAHRYESIL